MSLETGRTKAKLRAELEEIDLRRRAIESELEAVEKESDKPVMTRAGIEKLSPVAIMDFMRSVNAGEAILVD